MDYSNIGYESEMVVLGQIFHSSFLAKSAPEQKKTATAGTDGGYGDAGTGAAGGLRWPEKGRL